MTLLNFFQFSSWRNFVLTTKEKLLRLHPPNIKMHKGQRYFLVHFNGRAISLVLTLEHFQKIFGFLYCQALFKYISFVFNRLFPIILYKIFWSKIKKSNKVRLARKFLVSVRVHFMGGSANNPLLLWKLCTKLCAHTVFRFFYYSRIS